MSGAAVDAAYRAAFDAVLAKVQGHLKGAAPAAVPVRMYIAGGAALHLLTGERVTEDIDATFSKRVLIPDEIAVSYRDRDGRARLLYLDRNYNDTLGLLHKDAYDDSGPVDVAGSQDRSNSSNWRNLPSGGAGGASKMRGGSKTGGGGGAYAAPESRNLYL